MNRRTMLIGGGGVALILLFLWWRSRQAGQAGAGTPSDVAGTTSSQEASDFATLAGMVQQQQAQEQGDIASINSAIAAQGGQLTGAIAQGQAQEQGDIANLQNEYANNIQNQTASFQGQFSHLFPQAWRALGQLPHINKELAAIQAGQKKQRKVGHGHAKTGHRVRPTHPGHAPHSPHNHPAGTGGYAVAPRSHAPHVPTDRPAPHPNQHPAPHRPAPHPPARRRRR